MKALLRYCFQQERKTNCQVEKEDENLKESPTSFQISKTASWIARFMEAKKFEDFTRKLSEADDKDSRWTDAEESSSLVKSNTAFKILS